MPDTPNQAKPNYFRRVVEIAKERGAKDETDLLLGAAIIAQESAGNPQAESHMGAKGLMQFMPKTWEQYKPHADADPFDPEDNMQAGLNYIVDLKKRYKGDYRKMLGEYYGGGPNNPYVDEVLGTVEAIKPKARGFLTELGVGVAETSPVPEVISLADEDVGVYKQEIQPNIVGTGEDQGPEAILTIDSSEQARPNQPQWLHTDSAEIASPLTPGEQKRFAPPLTAKGEVYQDKWLKVEGAQVYPDAKKVYQLLRSTYAPNQRWALDEAEKLYNEIGGTSLTDSPSLSPNNFSRPGNSKALKDGLAIKVSVPEALTKLVDIIATKGAEAGREFYYTEARRIADANAARVKERQDNIDRWKAQLKAEKEADLVASGMLAAGDTSKASATARSAMERVHADWRGMVAGAIQLPTALLAPNSYYDALVSDYAKELNEESAFKMAETDKEFISSGASNYYYDVPIGAVMPAAGIIAKGLGSDLGKIKLNPYEISRGVIEGVNQAAQVVPAAMLAGPGGMYYATLFKGLVKGEDIGTAGAHALMAGVLGEVAPVFNKLPAILRPIATSQLFGAVGGFTDLRRQQQEWQTARKKYEYDLRVWNELRELARNGGIITTDIGPKPTFNIPEPKFDLNRYIQDSVTGALLNVTDLLPNGSHKLFLPEFGKIKVEDSVAWNLLRVHNSYIGPRSPFPPASPEVVAKTLTGIEVGERLAKLTNDEINSLSAELTPEAITDSLAAYEYSLSSYVEAMRKWEKDAPIKDLDTQAEHKRMLLELDKTFGEAKAELKPLRVALQGLEKATIADVAVVTRVRDEVKSNIEKLQAGLVKANEAMAKMEVADKAKVSDEAKGAVVNLKSLVEVPQIKVDINKPLPTDPQPLSPPDYRITNVEEAKDHEGVVLRDEDGEVVHLATIVDANGTSRQEYITPLAAEVQKRNLARLAKIAKPTTEDIVEANLDPLVLGMNSAESQLRAVESSTKAAESVLSPDLAPLRKYDDEPLFITQQRKIVQDSAKGQQANMAANLISQAIVMGYDLYRTGVNFADWLASMQSQTAKEMWPYLKGIWDKVSFMQETKVKSQVARNEDGSYSFTGEPVKVYHATSAEFDKFSTSKYGSATDIGWYGIGIYFGDLAESSQYAHVPSANIRPSWLRIENPLIWDYGKDSSMQRWLGRWKIEDGKVLSPDDQIGDKAWRLPEAIHDEAENFVRDYLENKIIVSNDLAQAQQTFEKVSQQLRNAEYQLNQLDLKEDLANPNVQHKRQLWLDTIVSLKKQKKELSVKLSEPRRDWITDDDLHQLSRGITTLVKDKGYDGVFVIEERIGQLQRKSVDDALLAAGVYDNYWAKEILKSYNAGEDSYKDIIDAVQDSLLAKSKEVNAIKAEIAALPYDADGIALFEKLGQAKNKALENEETIAKEIKAKLDTSVNSSHRIKEYVAFHPDQILSDFESWNPKNEKTGQIGRAATNKRSSEQGFIDPRIFSSDPAITKSINEMEEFALGATAEFVRDLVTGNIKAAPWVRTFNDVMLRNGQHLLAASKEGFEAFISAASTTPRVALELLKFSYNADKLLTTIGSSTREYFSFLQQDRIEGLRKFFTDQLDLVRSSNDSQIVLNFTRTGDIDWYDYIKALHEVTTPAIGPAAIPSPKQMVDMLLAAGDSGDFSGVRDRLTQTFQYALDNLATPFAGDYTKYAADPIVQQVNGLYKSSLHDLMAVAHHRSGGEDSTHLGPTGLYFPLISKSHAERLIRDAKGAEKKVSGISQSLGKRELGEKPKAYARHIATGLATEYTQSLEATKRSITAIVRRGDVAEFIGKMEDLGIFQPAGMQRDLLTGGWKRVDPPDDIENWVFVPAGPERVYRSSKPLGEAQVDRTAFGHPYTATTKASRAMTFSPGQKGYWVHKTIEREVRPLLESGRRFDSGATVENFMQKLVGYALFGLLEPTWHSWNVVKALQKSLPYIDIETSSPAFNAVVNLGLNTINPFLLGTPKLAFTLRRMFQQRAFSSDEARDLSNQFARAHELVEAGSLAERTGSVTFSTRIANKTGAELVGPHQWKAFAKFFNQDPLQHDVNEEKSFFQKVRDTADFGPIIYGWNGIDIRARLAAAEAIRKYAPTMPTNEVFDMLSTFGIYNRYLESHMGVWLKKTGLAPFYSAASAGEVRGVRSVVRPYGNLGRIIANRSGGDGSTAGMITNALAESGYSYTVMWGLAHHQATGLWPWEDDDARIGEIPMPEEFKQSAVGRILAPDPTKPLYMKMGFNEYLRGLNTLGLKGAIDTYLAFGPETTEKITTEAKTATAAQVGVVDIVSRQLSKTLFSNPAAHILPTAVAGQKIWVRATPNTVPGQGGLDWDIAYNAFSGQPLGAKRQARQLLAAALEANSFIGNLAEGSIGTGERHSLDNPWFPAAVKGTFGLLTNNLFTQPSNPVFRNMSLRKSVVYAKEREARKSVNREEE